MISFENLRESVAALPMETIAGARRAHATADTLKESLAAAGSARRRAANAMRESGGAQPPDDAQTADAHRRLHASLRSMIDGLGGVLPEMDAIVATVGERSHLRNRFVALWEANGYTRDEIKWMLDELNNVENRPISRLLPNGAADLLAILDAAAIDELGPLHAGFLVPRPGREDDVLALVARFREAGVTPSLYFVAAVTTLAALAVAAHPAESGGRGSWLESFVAGSGGDELPPDAETDDPDDPDDAEESGGRCGKYQKAYLAAKKKYDDTGAASDKHAMDRAYRALLDCQRKNAQ